MSNARNPLSALAFFAVLGGIVYFARHYGMAIQQRVRVHHPSKRTRMRADQNSTVMTVLWTVQGMKRATDGPKITASAMEMIATLQASTRILLPSRRAATLMSTVILNLKMMSIRIEMLATIPMKKTDEEADQIREAADWMSRSRKK